MSIDTRKLYDPSTKKCCPKRCMATANAIDSAVSAITIAVTRAINDSIQSREEHVDNCLSHVMGSIYQQVEQCEARLNNVYNDVHSQFLPKYADAVNTAERLLTEYHYEESENRSTEKPVPMLPMPEEQDQSNIPSPNKEYKPEEPPPSKVELKGNRPGCIEIDLCDELKRILLNVVNYININAPNITAALSLAADKPVPSESKDDKTPPMIYTLPDTYFVPIGDITESEEINTEGE